MENKIDTLLRNAEMALREAQNEFAIVNDSNTQNFKLIENRINRITESVKDLKFSLNKQRDENIKNLIKFLWRIGSEKEIITKFENQNFLIKSSEDVYIEVFEKDENIHSWNIRCYLNKEHFAHLGKPLIELLMSLIEEKLEKYPEYLKELKDITIISSTTMERLEIITQRFNK